MPWLHEILHFQQEPSVADGPQKQAGDTKQREIGPLRLGAPQVNFRVRCLAYTSSLHYECDHNASIQKPNPNTDMRTDGSVSVTTAQRGASIHETLPKDC